MSYILAIVYKALGISTKMGDAREDYKFRAYQFTEIKPRNSKRVPIPRSGHQVVADSRNLYVFGGYNPVSSNLTFNTEDEDPIYPLFQELWRFNFASREWTKYKHLENLPRELASNAAVRHNDLLMIYGGTGYPFGQSCSNELYVCRLSSENELCRVATTGQFPLPQYGQALVYDNGFLYTIGGTTGFTYTCDVHRLNLKTLVWEIVYICQGKEEYEPSGRYRHGVAFDGENIFVLGGGTADEVYDLCEIPTFNLKRRLWSCRKTFRDANSLENNGFPPSRRCHGTVQLDADSGIQVFVMGGFDGVQVFNDMWKLDLNTCRWTLMDKCSLPHATYFHSAAMSPEGKLYVFGGIFPNDTRTNKIFASWLCVPKLSELCWEAILQSNPGVISCERDKLISAGFPRCYVNRLQ